MFIGNNRASFHLQGNENLVNIEKSQNIMKMTDGPKYSSLAFCHWNLNGLTAHDSMEILLHQAYITHHNCGIRRYLYFRW